ncbi:MAG: hydroxymethylbilane synthase [Verrucomicrobiales bacterium]|nr:hydroxymethylbilane synthase [Verrucomicrobiales bacterium]
MASSSTGSRSRRRHAQDLTNPFRIATRGSALALAQANTVLRLCSEAFPGRRFELLILKTTGDKLQKASMRQPSASLPKGLFTKELEVALMSGAADLAVHSLKDLPTELPEGLKLGGVLPRADVRDVLVSRGKARGLRDLRTGAVVATSSARRGSQVRAARNDLTIVEIRGNVPTRLKKLAETEAFDATLLAAAGLKRLGISMDVRGRVLAPPALAVPGWGNRLFGRPLPVKSMLPAPGQAAIGLECRDGDAVAAEVCRRLNDAATLACVEAERAFLRGIGGGCQSPVAALARVSDSTVTLDALVFEGAGVWRARRSAPASKARSLGWRLGREARKALGIR